MKKSIFVSIVTVVLVGVVGVTGVFAQAPDPQTWSAGNSYGNQAAAQADGQDLYHDEMLASFSEVLGIPVETLQARIDAGETLMDIALDSGMTFEEVRVLMPMGGYGQQGAGQMGRWANNGTMASGQQMNTNQSALYGDGTCLEDGSAVPQFETQQNGTTRGGRWNR